MTDAAEISKDTRQTAQVLSFLAWGLFALMLWNVSAAVSERILTIDISESGWRFFANEFGLGLVAALPSLFFAFALWDFAQLFGRCGEGQVFTVRNTRTLRSGGDSLLLAAAASALISPTLTAWIGGDPGGFRFQANDLALGVGAVGLAIHGLANIFRDAVRVKEENDSFV